LVVEARAFALMREAAALQRAGRTADALEAYRKVLRLAPANPEAHNNMAVVLNAAGRRDDAVAAWRRAVRLRPGYALAHHHLGGALIDQGRHMDGLRHHLEAFRRDRDRPEFRQALAAALRPVRFAAASPAVREILLALFAADDLDHQDLAEASLGLLKAAPAFERAAAAAGAGDGADFAAVAADRRFTDWLADPLLQAVLRQTIVADATVEGVLTRLRRHWLLGLGRDGFNDWHRSALAALAHQCFNNEYLFEETPAETPAVAALPDRLGGGADDPALALYAAYRPLYTLPRGGRLPADTGPFADLVRRQVAEPGAEREIAATLPRLTAIDDPTSAAVRRQYEEGPYPRWLGLARRRPRSLAEVVGELFPGVDLDRLPAAAPRILVAGCGTGRHALRVACRYTDADVLAVDLSRAALAYGARLAGRMGIDNVRFAQADILHLGGLRQRFELIECSGVLHHMADPVAGWRVLTGLLAPNGLMKLGLYSRLGRGSMAAARRLVAERGFPATPTGIREARQAIRALPPDHPARAVAEEFDFFTTSACRDLLFNVQEVCFDVPEIAAAIDALGLEFLGFELFDDALRRAYRARFPAHRSLAELGNWDLFEREHPASFRTMYQFWCRRR
jgi:SAM-dependent methyltransferase